MFEAVLHFTEIFAKIISIIKLIRTAISQLYITKLALSDVPLAFLQKLTLYRTTFARQAIMIIHANRWKMVDFIKAAKKRGWNRWVRYLLYDISKDKDIVIAWGKIKHCTTIWNHFLFYTNEGISLRLASFYPPTIQRSLCCQTINVLVAYTNVNYLHLVFLFTSH